MKIAELFAEIGFKFDSIKLHDVSKLISDLNVSSIVGATSLASLGVGIKNIMEQSAKASTSLLNLKEATGLDPLRLQQLDVYFQEFGASAGEASQAIYNLNKLRLSVLQGNGDPQPFILTGLSPTTDTLALFDQIHEKFSDTTFLKNWAGSFAQGAKSLEEMRAAWKDMIANQFGIPTSMLRGLDQANEKWSEQSKILAFTEEEAKKNAEVFAKWVLATHDINMEVQKLVTNLAPIAIEALKIANAFVLWENKTQAIGGFFDRIGIAGTHLKAFGMNLDSGIKEQRNKVYRFLNPSFNKGESSSNLKQTNNITVHVTANNPHEFMNKFDEVWKRHIANADLQFGQSK